MYGGTKIIHKKTETLVAVVVGTGWNTRKGQLLGSVIYANEEKDRYQGDFLKMLIVQSIYHLICIAIIWVIAVH